MKAALVLFAAVAAGAGTIALSCPAYALGPVDLEVGARVGYGSNNQKGSGEINPLGVGLGARAGVSFFNIYGGAQVMYYFGGSQTELVGIDAMGNPVSAKVTETSLLYGFEGGYNFSFALLTIRPTLGIGNYTAHLNVSGGGSSDVHNVYVEPRATALIGLGLWYLGADVGLLVTPGLDGSQPAVLVNGQVGLKF